MFEKISLAGVSNAEWLRLRKTGIGGSDAGAVCGVNPYSSAMKVFQDKTGEAVEEQDSVCNIFIEESRLQKQENRTAGVFVKGFPAVRKGRRKWMQEQDRRMKRKRSGS